MPTHHCKNSRCTGRYGLAALGLAIPSAYGLYGLLGILWCDAELAGSESDAELRGLLGVRLGMTPLEVRQNFHQSSSGSSVASSTEQGQLVVDWEANAEAAWHSSPNLESPIRVTFEFHNAILVAIRADFVAPSDAKSSIDTKLSVSPSAVRSIISEKGRSKVVLIARDCPTHADEVQYILLSNKQVH
ncbi:MAG: hypothetical protein AAF355_06050 [Myxococcota bacterium]